MRVGYCEDCLAHDIGARHPESPDRLKAIRRGLTRQYGVEFVSAAPATVEQVRAIHDGSYVESVREFCADGGGQWGADTVAVEATFDAALSSAGFARWAVEAALSGADGRDTPFSAARPPGHHALVDDAMGFCFFNNAAVAARAALDAGRADRVAIVDWDVHHGNGTQELFYDRGDVLYVSLHEDGLYPGTGAATETGTGDGAGTTVNAPLPAGAGDADYLHVTERVAVPALSRFEPDLTVVSAGFDAHRHDPVSRTRLSTEGFALVTDRLRDHADRTDAPLAFVLEGGYGLDCLADGVGLVHETFDGRRPVEPDDDPDGAVAALAADLRDRLGL